VNGAARVENLAPLGPRTEQTVDGVYIIVLKNDANLEAHISWFDEMHSAAVRSHNPTAAANSGIIDTYDFGKEFQGYSAMLHSDMLKTIRQQHQVAYVDRDQLVYIDDDRIDDQFYRNKKKYHSHGMLSKSKIDDKVRVTSNMITRSTSLWNLARISHRTLKAPYDYTFPSTAGDGVEIHILDTGILATHNQFDGRVIQGVNLVTGETESDFNGHGTHVAGIAAGSAFGVAPEATIVNIKVMDKSGVGNFAIILAGLNWIVGRKAANPGTPMVANLSLSGPRSSAVNAAMSAATAAGVHVVVAAGNNGKDACSYSPASTGGNVISVGSIDSNNNLSSFSNRGTCVDILAPGGVIQSAGISANNAIAYKSGTSMAAPHVAGVVGLILADVGNVNPAIMKSTLVGTISTKNNVIGMNNCGGNNYLLFNQRIVGTSRPGSSRAPHSGADGDISSTEIETELDQPGPQLEEGLYDTIADL